MEIDGLREFPQDRQDFHDLGRVRGQVGLLHRGGELGRGRQVQRERNILRQVARTLVQAMLVDKGAHLVARGLRLR